MREKEGSARPQNECHYGMMGKAKSKALSLARSLRSLESQRKRRKPETAFCWFFSLSEASVTEASLRRRA